MTPSTAPTNETIRNGLEAGNTVLGGVTEGFYAALKASTSLSPHARTAIGSP